MSTALRIDAQGKDRTAHQVALPEADAPDLGLQAVEEGLKQEVQALADQKSPLLVPRVRNRQAGIEVPSPARPTKACSGGSSMLGSRCSG